METENHGGNDGDVPVEELAGSAIEQVGRPKHGENGKHSQGDLARTQCFGPEPKKKRICGNAGPPLARQDLCEAAFDGKERDRLIQPKRRADGKEPDGNGHAKSQGVHRVPRPVRHGS